MAWISVHGTIVGKKLRGLSKRTGQSSAECIGALVLLWLWGLDNADEDGEIGNADEDDIAEVLHGKTAYAPRAFVDGMIAEGWIDREDGKLFFHDWSTWQEQWYKALKKRERDRINKSRKNHGEPDADDETPSTPPETKYSPEFEELWKYYPRKVTKDATYKKYLARRKEGWTHEQLLEATIAYSAQVKRKGTQQEYIKHGETFFGPTRPFKDYLRQKPEQPPVETGIEGKNPYSEYKEET